MTTVHCCPACGNATPVTRTLRYALMRGVAVGLMRIAGFALVLAAVVALRQW